MEIMLPKIKEQKYKQAFRGGYFNNMLLVIACFQSYRAAGSFDGKKRKKLSSFKTIVFLYFLRKEK
jgi:hypothetical protein